MKHAAQTCCVCHESLLLVVAEDEPIQACGVCGVALHSHCLASLPAKRANDCKRVALTAEGAKQQEVNEDAPCAGRAEELHQIQRRMTSSR